MYFGFIFLGLLTIYGDRKWIYKTQITKIDIKVAFLRQTDTKDLLRLIKKTKLFFLTIMNWWYEWISYFKYCCLFNWQNKMKHTCTKDAAALRTVVSGLTWPPVLTRSYPTVAEHTRAPLLVAPNLATHMLNVCIQARFVFFYFRSPYSRQKLLFEAIC